MRGEGASGTLEEFRRSVKPVLCSGAEQQEQRAMTVARRLAGFLTETTTADLSPQALDHAAMLIASTIASAACGTRIEPARIIRGVGVPAMVGGDGAA